MSLDLAQRLPVESPPLVDAGDWPPPPVVGDWSSLRKCWIIAGVLLYAGFFAFAYDMPVARFFLAQRLTGGGQPNLTDSQKNAIREQTVLIATPGDLRKMFYLSEIFGHGFGAALTMLGIYIFDRRGRRYLPRMMAAIAAAGLIGNMLKNVVGRVRPHAFSAALADPNTQVWDSFVSGPLRHIGDSINQSMPSGHASLAFGLAVTLAWRYPRGRWFFYTLAALVAMQRMIAGSHYPSDVIAGAAVAVAIAGTVLYSPTSRPVFQWWEGRAEKAAVAENQPRVKIAA